MKTVVLTFDDAVSNHAGLVAPLLTELGFGATFFVCEFPPDFAVNKRQYMTWEQIRSLHRAGFEVGNHTLTHAGLRRDLVIRERQSSSGVVAEPRRCRGPLNPA